MCPSVGAAHPAAIRLERALADLPGLTPTRVEITPRPSEGFALVEGFCGDIFVHVRIGDGGRLACVRPRDPSWFPWPPQEAAIEGL